MNANDILKKHEDANEMHFHEVDRKWIIEAMEEYAALSQPPIIRSGRWKCMLCGRDKFTHKSPHKCVGGFRKRKIIWQEV